MNYFYKGIINFNNYTKQNEKYLQREIENFFSKHLKRIRFTHRHLTSSKYKKGIPDGILYYKNKQCIFELKYTLSSGYDYNKQLVQALCYYLLNPKSKVIVIASEKYFDYLKIDENLEIINKYKDKLLTYLEAFSPRTVADNVKINDEFIIHKNVVNKDINLRNIMNNIFNNDK